MNLEPVLDLDTFDPIVLSGWEEDQKSVLIPVARCHETNCVVQFRCHLAPVFAISHGCWEFSFDMYVHWLDDSEPDFKTQERNSAYHYIPAEIRASVVPAVCLCVAPLVEACSPLSIYRVTKGRNLQEKALQKHHIIAERFNDLGYGTEETGLDRSGRMYWLMS